MVLRGRCLERESVPYKGIDSVVDALSDLPASTRARSTRRGSSLATSPRSCSCSRSSTTSGKAALGPWIVDPGELRRRGFASLREVFTRVAEQHPLVVYVDDFQWADVDSARLLTELMRPPDPPALLLVITYRDEVGEREVLQLLNEADAIEGRDVRELEIGPLSSEEAHELAATLLRERATAKLGISSGSGASPAASAGGSPSPTADPPNAAVSAEALARRAQGNPFYIGQMVLGDDAHNSDDASLDRLVARRIVALEPAQRRVLATVAVAAGPTPLPVILQACAAIDADATIDEQTIAALLGANLLMRQAPNDLATRTSGSRPPTIGSASSPSASCPRPSYARHTEPSARPSSSSVAASPRPSPSTSTSPAIRSGRSTTPRRPPPTRPRPSRSSAPPSSIAGRSVCSRPTPRPSAVGCSSSRSPSSSSILAAAPRRPTC